MKAGNRILAAGGLVLAAAFGSAAVAEDSGPPGNTDPFQGVAVVGTEHLAGASGQAIGVPGPGFPLATAAQGNATCTHSEGDSCRATATSIVNVVGSADVAAGSFNTKTRISATNILSSQFDTGSITLGNAAADAAAAAAAR